MVKMVPFKKESKGTKFFTKNFRKIFIPVKKLLLYIVTFI